MACCRLGLVGIRRVGVVLGHCLISSAARTGEGLQFTFAHRTSRTGNDGGGIKLSPEPSIVRMKRVNGVVSKGTTNRRLIVCLPEIKPPTQSRTALWRRGHSRNHWTEDPVLSSSAYLDIEIYLPRLLVCRHQIRRVDVASHSAGSNFRPDPVWRVVLRRCLSTARGASNQRRDDRGVVEGGWPESR